MKLKDWKENSKEKNIKIRDEIKRKTIKTDEKLK